MLRINNDSALKLVDLNYRFIVIIADYHKDIMTNIHHAAVETLHKAGVKQDHIRMVYVPGAFELPYAAHKIALSDKQIDCIICLGCVIKGETPHFDFICQAVAKGLLDVSLKHDIPIIFGVLTTNAKQQALDRSGGKLGNKGIEAAQAAIQMVNLNYVNKIM